jgi:hypothetical protein
VSTGAVGLSGVVVEVVDVVPEPVGVVGDSVDPCAEPAWGVLFPLPEESTIATITPPTAAAATAAARAAFFTGSVVTLAPPCLHASRSS